MSPTLLFEGVFWWCWVLSFCVFRSLLVCARKLLLFGTFCLILFGSWILFYCYQFSNWLWSLGSFYAGFFTSPRICSGFFNLFRIFAWSPGLLIYSWVVVLCLVRVYCVIHQVYPDSGFLKMPGFPNSGFSNSRVFLHPGLNCAAQVGSLSKPNYSRWGSHLRAGTFFDWAWEFRSWLIIVGPRYIKSVMLGYLFLANFKSPGVGPLLACGMWCNRPKLCWAWAYTFSAVFWKAHQWVLNNGWKAQYLGVIGFTIEFIFNFMWLAYGYGLDGKDIIPTRILMFSRRCMFSIFVATSIASFGVSFLGWRGYAPLNM